MSNNNSNDTPQQYDIHNRDNIIAIREGLDFTLYYLKTNLKEMEMVIRTAGTDQKLKFDATVQKNETIKYIGRINKALMFMNSNYDRGLYEFLEKGLKLSCGCHYQTDGGIGWEYCLYHEDEFSP